MSTTKPTYLLILGLMTVNACTYNAQVVRLDPALPELSAGQGGGIKNVRLQTQDLRPSKDLGRRAGNPDAVITADPDAGDVLRSKVVEILRAKGLRAVDSDASDALTLAVDLKELSYTVYTEAQARKLKIRASLKVVAQKGPERLEISF